MDLLQKNVLLHIIRKDCFRFFYKFYRLDSCSSLCLLSTSIRKLLQLHGFIKFSEEHHWLPVPAGIQFKPLVFNLHHFIYISWVRTPHQLRSSASAWEKNIPGTMSSSCSRNQICLSHVFSSWCRVPHQLRSLTPLLLVCSLLQCSDSHLHTGEHLFTLPQNVIRKHLGSFRL